MAHLYSETTLGNNLFCIQFNVDLEIKVMCIGFV